MFDGLADIPKEPLIYEVGGIIFASALSGFSHVMRKMLGLIGRRGVWILPMVGAVLMLAAVGLHAYANYFLVPVMEPGSAVVRQVYQFRFIALIAMLVSSLVTLTGAGIFWLMFTGPRQRT